MSAGLERLLHTIDEAGDRLVAAIVHFNDTYLIEERAGARLPGLPRVIATVARLRNHIIDRLGRDLTLVVHSGDFLGPSRQSQRDHGKAMVELLNRAGVRYCVLGNHEFDHGEPSLVERATEAKFEIVMCNVRTAVLPIKRVAMWPDDENPLIAITGVVSESVHRAFGEQWEFLYPGASLAEFAEETADVPFHVVLSHANRDEDRQLRVGLPTSRWYFLGGHDHDIDWVEDDGLPVFKNRSNLETVRVLLLLAGGVAAQTAAMGHCDNLHDERYYELLRQQEDQFDIAGDLADSEPLYPDDVPIVLNRLHPVDAAPLR